MENKKRNTEKLGRSTTSSRLIYIDLNTERLPQNVNFDKAPKQEDKIRVKKNTNKTPVVVEQLPMER